METFTPAIELGQRQRRAFPVGGSKPTHDHETAVQSSGHHADANETFYTDFEELYNKIANFANKFFGRASPTATSRGRSPWLRNLPREFLKYTEMVACADVASGGWDRILLEPTQRKCVVVGILARILEVKVFQELLFGVTEQQKKRLLDLERLLFLEHEEGFKRTAERSVSIRALVGRSGVPTNRANAIDRLCRQIEVLFQPLRDYLEDSYRDSTLPFPSLEDQSRDLHEIVSVSADLSVKIRLSSTIFYFSSEVPGNRFNRENQQSVDQPAYLASKAAVATSCNDARRQAASNYGPLIKFALWPSIRRYSPGNGKADGINKGYRIYDICKSRVVYYWGPDHRLQEHEPSLQEFIDRQRRESMRLGKLFVSSGQRIRRINRLINLAIRQGKVILLVVLLLALFATNGVPELRNISMRIGELAVITKNNTAGKVALLRVGDLQPY